MVANDSCEPVLRLEIPASEEYRTLRVAAGLSAMTAAFRLYEQFGFKLVAPAAHGMLLRL